MRLYWPKSEAPSILPAGDGTWKPPGIVAVNSDFPRTNKANH
jgi:hypothetical protein